jgi:multidrug efflux pump subunit AcrA (membrane-fusion protein)
MSMINVSKRKLLIGGLFCLIVIGLIIGAVRPSKRALGAVPGATPDVEVVKVQQEDVPIYGEWIGTLDGLVNADVRAQVTGYLLKQGYQEGAFVKQGQLLFQIDPRPFQAALDQAQGQLSVDIGVLLIYHGGAEGTDTGPIAHGCSTTRGTAAAQPFSEV